MSFIALRVSLERLIDRLVATGFVFRSALGRAGKRARIVAMELCATNDRRMSIDLRSAFGKTWNIRMG